jgi:trigger factor
MKTEFADVNETRKNVHVEIPSDVVSAEIDRIARDYSRKVRVPGFRPGKAPARVIKQRYKEQILHDVAQDLIPRAVDDALRERGMEAVDTPDIRDVSVEDGRPLTFTASFDTVPPFEPGDYSTLALRRSSSRVEEDAVDQALQRLRDRAARFEPVEGRGVEAGDTVVADLERHETGPGSSAGGTPGEQDSRPRNDVTIELGAKANPPGFDEQLLGLEAGATKTFAIHYPSGYAIGELADTDVAYTVNVKGIKRRIQPELDDEFAKDLGEFETLDALRARVREDLEHQARHKAEGEIRADLMKQLSLRVPFEVPPSLLEREIDRRIEDFAHRLVEQNLDPRQAGIDWAAFRESQRDAARQAVAGAIVLDEVARREQLDVTEEEIEREIARYAERSGRVPAAVRAGLAKEGGLSRVAAGLRREKSIDFLLARATITGEL